MGRVSCRTCQSFGRLKWYLQLKIVYEINKDDFFKKVENIPDKELRECLAKNIFSEQNFRVKIKDFKNERLSQHFSSFIIHSLILVKVYPITNHTDQDINNASAGLISTHMQKFLNSRILSQV
jgi:hypothetical protein